MLVNFGDSSGVSLSTQQLASLSEKDQPHQGCASKKPGAAAVTGVYMKTIFL